MIDLRIVTPMGLYRHIEAKSVHLKTSLGETTILPSHMPIISDIVPCRLVVTDKDGRRREYAISSGFMQFAGNKMLILADAVEGRSEIDLARAQQAYKRARERLDKKDSDTNLKRAELSLQRAINRIHVSSGK